MKSRLSQFLAPLIPALLPLLLGILYISAFPSYDTELERTEYIQSEYLGAEIISQQNFPKYIICEFRSDEGIGYCLFQKILGRWQYDHSVVTEESIAVGDFYMGDTFHHALVTSIDNANSVTITYVNITSGEIVREETIETNGQTMFVVPAAKDNHEIYSIAFFDASGQPIPYQ